MRRKCTSDTGFLTPRIAVALVVSAISSCIVTVALLAFFRTETSANDLRRTLTFAERVAYQRAIEEVYWRHRIWPKENPNPRPSLDAVIPRAELEMKVAAYISDSQTLEHYWQHPITTEQLQAEVDRMAQNTKRPEVLRELFDVLGNDPVGRHRRGFGQTFISTPFSCQSAGARKNSSLCIPANQRAACDVGSGNCWADGLYCSGNCCCG